ncbi:MAG: hypothetical protein COC19_05545 [SAR86 cluster bacterium]|uniref:Uncharacterized protein n=1 Tax=SAR86 cluster bacterium TaxID=2030880 RepID=A0A2A4MKG9_9GAMM|nr:MAG: hypothetical protein COC19_05545 [SAR86 cluster bacterium]
MQSPSNNSEAQSLEQAYSMTELEALIQHIIDSGELGRSKNYSTLLIYLAAENNSNRHIKEVEIAIEVLGKSTDFDIAKNSAVRVTVHQLRKKLDNYYKKYGSSCSHRITIPIGHYCLEAVPLESAPPLENAKINKQIKPFLLKPILITIAIGLISNLLYSIWHDKQVAKDLSQASNDSLSLWQSLIEGELPILIVLGDYYVHPDISVSTDIQALVSDFNANSQSKLDDLPLSDVLTTQNYLDLDLSYMPLGSAFVLARLVPILQKANKQVNITMMADLSSEDTRQNHIVYVGYLAALDQLSSVVFSASGLQIGRDYDELVNLNTREIYTSDNFTSENNDLFHDYGMISTFTMPESNNRAIIIAGMRDAGLMYLGQILSTSAALGTVPGFSNQARSATLNNFEALYEVYGTDNMNFNGQLVYKEPLQTENILRKGITTSEKQGIGNSNQ